MAGVAMTVGALAVTASLAVGCAVSTAVSVRSVRLSGIADAAALAAADTLSGAAWGIPCERAEQIVRRGGARLEACEIDEAVATVVVTAPFGAFTVRARARAGPAL